MHKDLPRPITNHLNDPEDDQPPPAFSAVIPRSDQTSRDYSNNVHRELPRRGNVRNRNIVYYGDTERTMGTIFVH